MNAPLPPQIEIVLKNNIESSSSYSIESKSESDSDSENTKTQKPLSLNSTLEALKELNTFSENYLPQLEENAEKHAKTREKSIAEQQKTNELLMQLAKHLEKLETTHTDIAALKINHSISSSSQEQNIQTLLNNSATTRKDISALQADLIKINSKNHDKAIAMLLARTESLEKANHSLLRKVQLYMTGSVAILAISFWIWWKSHHA